MIALLLVVSLTPYIRSQDFSETIERYATDKRSLESFYSIAVSPRRWERIEKFLEEWKRKLDGMNYNALGLDEKIDYHLLKNEIEYEKILIERERRKFEEIEKLVPFAASIIELEEKRWRVEPFDSRKVANGLEEIAVSIREARKAVEADQNSPQKKITPSMGLRASKVVEELARVLDTWVQNYQGFDPIFSWWVKKPFEKTKKELGEYGDFLRRRVAGIQGNESDPLNGEPIGREAILEDLKHEMIPYTPEEFIRVGAKNSSNGASVKWKKRRRKWGRKVGVKHWHT